jgi:hypothetical protein
MMKSPITISLSTQKLKRWLDFKDTEGYVTMQYLLTEP